MECQNQARAWEPVSGGEGEGIPQPGQQEGEGHEREVQESSPYNGSILFVVLEKKLTGVKHILFLHNCQPK